MTDVPHFDFPFQFVAGSAAEVEQDSLDDIGNCVTAALLTPLAWRKELPEFGVEDRTFSQQPVNWTDLVVEIINSESRADILVESDPEGIKERIAAVRLDLRAREEQVKVADIYNTAP